MIKSELKDGDYVRSRKGERFVVRERDGANVFFILYSNSFIPFSKYNEDLSHKKRREHDIVYIYAHKVIDYNVMKKDLFTARNIQNGQIFDVYSGKSISDIADESRTEIRWVTWEMVGGSDGRSGEWEYYDIPYIYSNGVALDARGDYVLINVKTGDKSLASEKYIFENFEEVR